MDQLSLKRFVASDLLQTNSSIKIAFKSVEILTGLLRILELYNPRSRLQHHEFGRSSWTGGNLGEF